MLIKKKQMEKKKKESPGQTQKHGKLYMQLLHRNATLGVKKKGHHVNKLPLKNKLLGGSATSRCPQV